MSSGILRHCPSRAILATLVFAALTYQLLPVVASAQLLEIVQPYQRYVAARGAGDFDAAARFARQALQIEQSEYGADSLETVATLEQLAEVLALAARYPEAAARYRRALEIREQNLGTDHPDLVPTLEALADTAIRQGNLSEAESWLLRVLEIERSLYGPRSDSVVATLRSLRDVYERAGRVADVERIESEIEAATFVARGFEAGPGDVDGRRYASEEGYATVRVFYGTNRARTGDPRPGGFYGGARGELEVGFLDVTIPKSHRYGELETESRWSVYSYILGEAAKKRRYVLLVGVTPLDEDDFHDELREHVESSPSNDAFVFVHGYNTSFADAARRTAQLAYDIDFDGTPMMYSWPSQGTKAAYTIDEAVVRLSGRMMSRFLEDIVDRSGAERIHLIAHSMGNRAMIEALGAYLARHAPAEPTPVFDQILFTAPDVDRDYFIEVIDDVRRIAKRVTLYASENDVALQTSRIVHGAPRAGQAGLAIVALPGLDTIDMSAVEGDLLGHNYFAASQGAIHDVFRLLWRGDPPPSRCGMLRPDEQQLFWLFSPDNCRGTDLLQASVILKRFGGGALDRVRSRIEALTDPSPQGAKEEWQRILQRLEALLATEAD